MHMYSLINHSYQLLGYCLSSICSWWYQGELGFCCKEAEPCINVYGRVWLYINKENKMKEVFGRNVNIVLLVIYEKLECLASLQLISNWVYCTKVVKLKLCIAFMINRELRLNSHQRYFRCKLLRELFSPHNHKKLVHNPLLNFSV